MIQLATNSSTRNSLATRILTETASWYLVLLVAVIPWPNGSIEWKYQSLILFSMVIPLLLLVWVGLFDRTRFRVPMAVWLLLGFAGLGILQTLPLFSAVPSGWQPNAIRIQTWFAGQSKELDRTWMNQAMQSAPASIPLKTPTTIEDAAPMESTSSAGDSPRYAIAVDPEHTRAAVGTLTYLAVILWLTAVVPFSKRQWMMLWGTMTGIAVFFSGLILLQATAVELPAWLDSSRGPLVAVFRSKNVAGGYLLIGLAGCVGLLAQLPSVSSPKPLSMRAVGWWERRLADLVRRLQRLTWQHFAMMLLLIWLILGLLATQSRGATLAMVAGFFFMLMIFRGQRRGWQMIGLGIFAFALATGLLAYFDLDQATSSRYQSLLDVPHTQTGRFFAWWGALRASMFYGLTGCGLGNYGYGLLPFYDGIGEVWVYYAESLWGQVVAEFGVWGWLGIGLVLGSWIPLFQAARNASGSKSSTRLPCIVFAFGAVAQFFHSLIDFCMIVPAVGLSFMILWGSAWETCGLGNPVVRRPWSSMLGWGAWVLSAILVWSSWEPMSVAARGDSIARATDRLYQQQGKWELPEVEALLRECESLPSISSRRHQGMLKALIWRRELIAFTKESFRLELGWDQTSPVLLRLAEKRLRSREGEWTRWIGGESSLQKWKEINRTFEQASAANRLDWQAEFHAILFDLESPEENQKARLLRWRPLANNTPQLLLEAGLLLMEWQCREEGESLLQQAFELKPSLVAEAGSVLTTQGQDGDFHLYILPRDTGVLLRLAERHFRSESFPLTHRRLMERCLEVEGKKIASDQNPEWMVKVHRALGNTNQEIEFLERLANRRNPMPQHLQMWVEALERAGRVDEAKGRVREAAQKFPEHAPLQKLFKRFFPNGT